MRSLEQWILEQSTGVLCGKHRKQQIKTLQPQMPHKLRRQGWATQAHRVGPTSKEHEEQSDAEGPQVTLHTTALGLCIHLHGKPRESTERGRMKVEERHGVQAGQYSTNMSSRYIELKCENIRIQAWKDTRQTSKPTSRTPTSGDMNSFEPRKTVNGTFFGLGYTLDRPKSMKKGRAGALGGSFHCRPTNMFNGLMSRCTTERLCMKWTPAVGKC